jgi:hypothetical protein
MLSMCNVANARFLVQILKGCQIFFCNEAAVRNWHIGSANKGHEFAPVILSGVMAQ